MDGVDPNHGNPTQLDTTQHEGGAMSDGPSTSTCEAKQVARKDNTCSERTKETKKKEEDAGSRGWKGALGTVLVAILAFGCFQAKKRTDGSLEESQVEQAGETRQACPHASEVQATLYRILGNEVPGRHKQGQTLQNLQYMLEHEPELEGWRKRFVLNRMVNQTLERQVMDMLQGRGLDYLRIEFEKEEYRRITLDTDCLPHPDYLLSDEFNRLKESRQARLMFSIYRLKNIYVYNNNGARNAALREGKHLGNWTLPWDGNCFLEKQGWIDISEAMCSSNVHYLTVPMRRLVELPHDSPANADCLVAEEPQIAFHCNSNLTFDEEFYYGHLSKVELLKRLGASRTWIWREDMGFGLHCPKSDSSTWKDMENRMDVTVGSVARLPSAFDALEQGPNTPSSRNKARVQGGIDFLFSLDLNLQQQTLNDTIFYNLGGLEVERSLYQQGKDPHLQALVDCLIKDGESILSRRADDTGTELGHEPKESGSCIGSNNSPSSSHMEDDQAAPHTSKKSSINAHQCGHTRSAQTATFHRVASDVTVCTLASFFNGNKTFAQHAAEQLSSLVLDRQAPLLPNLTMDSSSGTKAPWELHDIVSIHHLLDAVRLLARSGFLEQVQIERLEDWLHDLHQWLTGTALGKEALQATGHNGVLYDLVVASVAAYRDARFTLVKALARAQSRISNRFSQGILELEQEQFASAEDMVYECEGWVSMAYLSGRLGNPLWCYRDRNGYSVKAWITLLLERARSLSATSKNSILVSRIAALAFLINQPTCTTESVSTRMDKYAFRSALNYESALRPYWNLGLMPTL